MDAQERAIRAIANSVALDKGKNVPIHLAEQIRQAEQAAREKALEEVAIMAEEQWRNPHAARKIRALKEKTE